MALDRLRQMISTNPQERQPRGAGEARHLPALPGAARPAAEELKMDAPARPCLVSGCRQVRPGLAPLCEANDE